MSSFLNSTRCPPSSIYRHLLGLDVNPRCALSLSANQTIGDCVHGGNGLLWCEFLQLRLQTTLVPYLGSSEVLVGRRFLSFHTALFLGGGGGDADGGHGLGVALFSVWRRHTQQGAVLARRSQEPRAVSLCHSICSCPPPPTPVPHQLDHASPACADHSLLPSAPSKPSCVQR